MSAPDMARQYSLEGLAVPPIALELAGDDDPVLAWRNELDGLTFRLGERYLKWNPPGTGVDLERERARLDWLAPRHPAPRVIDGGVDATGGQWLLTRALPGESAVSPRWRQDPAVAVAAIAAGLRAIHALPVDEAPADWGSSWATRAPAALGPRPPTADPVVVHGDACAPNTLLDDRGSWCGHVDVGDLTVGDRWADLAVASMSLDWNYGEGWQDAFFAAYGVVPDPGRIRYYRALWDLES